VGCRIVELERDPPPAVASFGKITLELWDVSGDFKYEKCWGPIQRDAHGLIFVYNPAAPGTEDILNQLVQLFPKQMQLAPKFCLAIANHHNTGGAIVPNAPVPKCMEALDKHNGTAEDSNGIFQSFEKYLLKLIKILGEQQKDEESRIMA
jgi:Rab-like protein 5